MNNKGQTLATFIIIIPVLLFLIFAITDYGLMSVTKRHAENSVKDSIKYGLNNINENNINEEIKNLLYENIKKEDIKKLDININDNTVSIDISINYKSLFNVLKNKNDIILSYVGNISDNKIKITKR